MGAQPALLVERELELERLEQLLADARAGSGGGLVFEGPAGIGKSSLLAAARAAAGAELRVLTARGGELERELPFGVVRQLLEPAMAAAGDDERDGLLAGAAALAKPVLFAADTDGGAEPSFSALHGLYWLTINLADSRPLLLAIDDAQWADFSSLRWLIYLARRLAGVPLALVLASRPAEHGPVQALLDELLVIPEISVLHPGGLSDRAITVLAAQLLPVAPDPTFVTACRRATGGNPFLLIELFGELERRRIAPVGANSELAGELSSHGLGRAVRSRLRLLPPACTALARAVAVLGDPAEPTLAAELAGADGAEAARAADALAEAAVFEPGRQLAFAHPLVRSGVYSELSAQERARLHERAAGLLRAAGQAPDRIAVHLLATHPDGDAETVTMLRRAARDARTRGAPDVAVTYLRRALAEQGAPALEPELSYELGSAALSAGELEPAVEQLRRATRDAADPKLRAEAADALGSALFLVDRPEEALTELTAIIDALPASQHEQGLRLQATRWAAVRGGSVASWRRLRAMPKRFVVTSPAPRTIGERLHVAVAAYEVARMGTAREARELALQALAEGALLANPGPDSGGFWIAPAVLLLAHADEDGARVATEVLEWAEQHGSLPAFSLAAQLRAYHSLRRGSLGEAEADAVNGLEHPGLPGLYGRLALVDILLARGGPPRRRKPSHRPVRRPKRQARSGTCRRAPGYGRPRGGARTRSTIYSPAAALSRNGISARPPSATGARTPCRCLRRSTATTRRVSWLARKSNAVAASAHRRLLGIALRALGRVEPGDEGIELLEQAVIELEASPARLEQAISRLELGAAIRRAGRRADAREWLREALELARACGADAVAVRAHDELVTAGARPRRDPTESRRSLTASEQRVARMAAGGMTNRQVAQALFLTENTIETHLRSVFRKLEIGSRSQLARAL